MKIIICCQLDIDFAARLKRFTQAAMTMKSRVIRAALEKFIDDSLRENDGLRERFERYTLEDEVRAAAPSRGHLKVIK